MLNLKNDGLRKRFDGIKYDLKKVEEVVYDLSIRGLDKANETEVSTVSNDEVVRVSASIANTDIDKSVKEEKVTQEKV